MLDPTKLVASPRQHRSRHYALLNKTKYNTMRNRLRTLSGMSCSGGWPVATAPNVLGFLRSALRFSMNMVNFPARSGKQGVTATKGWYQ